MALRLNVFRFDDDAAWQAYRYGVHYLPYLNERGEPMLGALTSDNRLVAARAVPQGEEHRAPEICHELWEKLKRVQPEPPTFAPPDRSLFERVVQAIKRLAA